MVLNYKILLRVSRFITLAALPSFAGVMLWGMIDTKASLFVPWLFGSYLTVVSFYCLMNDLDEVSAWFNTTMFIGWCNAAYNHGVSSFMYVTGIPLGVTMIHSSIVLWHMYKLLREQENSRD